MLKDIRNFLNGSVYGMVLTIPGVSATLFAIILKFYDELIYAINHFKEERRKNTRYLGVFLLGIGAGAVLFSSLLMLLLNNFHFPTMMFFIGLLLGMIPLVAQKAFGSSKSPSRINTKKAALIAVSMLALLALSRAVDADTFSPAYSPDAMNMALALYILLAGIINGATLVIPGLSGAFILLIMGLFPLIISSISAIGLFLGDVSNIALLREIAVVLAPFAIGGVIGCLAMARVMGKLLDKHNEAVYAVILGLLLGSVITLALDNIAIQGDQIQNGQAVMYYAAGCVMLLLGAFAAYKLGKKH